MNDFAGFFYFFFYFGCVIFIDVSHTTLTTTVSPDVITDSRHETSLTYETTTFQRSSQKVNTGNRIFQPYNGGLLIVVKLH